MRNLLFCFIVLACFQCAPDDTPAQIDSSLTGKYIIWAEEKGFESLPVDRQNRRKVYRGKYPTQVDLNIEGTAIFTYSNGTKESGKWKASGESFEIYDVKVGSKGDKFDKNQFEGKYTADGNLKGVLVFKNSEQKIYLKRMK